MKNRFLSVILLLILSVMVFVACEKAPTVTVTLDKSSLILSEDESSKLTVNVSNSDETPIWNSSDVDCVTVDSAGNVLGKKVGSATITVAVGDVYAQCAVTVTAASESESRGIDFGIDAIRLSLSGALTSYTLEAALYDYSQDQPQKSDIKLTYTIADSSIATVDSNGFCTPLKVGTTTVSASADGVTEEITLQVFDDTVSSADEWMAMFDVDGNLNKHYAVVSDIDFSGVTYVGPNTATWDANDNNVNGSVTGLVDGFGHKISNITFQTSADTYCSIFGWLNGATICNLQFENVLAKAFDDNGTLHCGAVGGICDTMINKKNNTIENVRVDITFEAPCVGESAAIVRRFYAGVVRNVIVNISTPNSPVEDNVWALASFWAPYNYPSVELDPSVDSLLILANGETNLYYENASYYKDLTIINNSVYFYTTKMDAVSAAIKYLDSSVWNFYPNKLPDLVVNG